MVRALLALVVLLLAGCPPAGDTCGRGRCHSGTCVVSLRTYTALEQPSFDAWCVEPCPADLACPGQCLRNPSDFEDLMCAGTQLELTYYLDGGTVRLADEVLEVEQYTVLSERLDGGRRVCVSGELCSAGVFSTGDEFPQLQVGRRLLPYSGSPDTEARTLGPYLPTGLELVIVVGGFIDRANTYVVPAANGDAANGGGAGNAGGAGNGGTP